jgi:hypothetical protein
MAKKCAAFEEQAVQLAGEVYLATPTQYRVQPDPVDPLNRAWNVAAHATLLAVIVLEQLGNLLRAKAGIIEPGPTARFFADGLESNGRGPPDSAGSSGPPERA